VTGGVDRKSMTTHPTEARRASTVLVDAVRQAGVRDARVIQAFQNVARRQFVPAEAVDRAEADEPIPIGHDQVTTQPSLIARMVEALELSGDERVLEIGTGLGYQAAILGALSREVYSIERWPDLAAHARDNLRVAGRENVVVCVGDGTLGLPDHAPYDAIVIAAAAPVVPSALSEQLTEGGRLVQPMGPGGNEIVVQFRKRGVGLAWERNVVEARFVPLIAGPSGDVREPDFNLLVSAHPLAAGRARREIAARLRTLTDTAPEIMHTSARGILAVRVAIDPREVVQQLRALCQRQPGAFRYTLRWVPVDRWTRRELPAMREAIAQLRRRIGPNETWRMTVERRTDTTGLEPGQVIRSLAELIDARVELSRPDKIVLVQLFDDWVSFSIVATNETFSVVKLRAAQPRQVIAPPPADERRSG
jgi:protein-L-isoaspartate(D-aspartate) O-methyltransferase